MKTIRVSSYADPKTKRSGGHLPAFWKNYGPCLIAPAAASALLLIVYWVYHLFPFARYIFAWGDMTQQSIPLLLDFKNILSGQFDLFLNTANAGGMSFWGVFLFFLSSPFSFLVALIDSKDIYLFSNLLVLMKMAACAFTASLFFHKQFPRLTISQYSALAVMYAFCGYAMFYYQNLVWLDMLCVFPLLLLGLCRLIQKGKIGLYTVMLTATVAINYYLSYMVILFLILSMGVYVFWACEKDRRKKTVALFGFSSLIAALLSAVCWLPSFLQYTQSARTTGILESLAGSKLFTSVSTTFPVILCTASVMAIIPMVFLSRIYRKRTVQALFCSYVLLLIPVVLEPINKMWHTGSYQAFPVRYGYITVMLGLCLTAMFLSRGNDAQRLAHPKVKTSPSILLIVSFHIAALACVGVLLLVFKQDQVSSYVGRLWMSTESFLYFLLFAGLAALVYFMFYLLYHNLMVSRRVFSVILCCAVACESFFCSSVFIGSGARFTWSYDNALDLGYHTKTDDLFRTKLNRKYFDVNLVGALGYNSLSHYTSLTDEDYLFTMKKLGYSAYWMEVGSNGGTLLTDMLLANRYVITKNLDTDVPDDDKLYRGLVYCIVENDSVTSFGTTFQSDDIAALETLPTGSRMELQQYLSDLFYDCGKIVQSYEPEKRINLVQTTTDGNTNLKRIVNTRDGYLQYTIPVKGTQTLYFDCFDQTTTALKEAINDSFDVSVNDVRVESGYPTQKNNGLLNLGTFTDETVKVEVKVRKNMTARSFGLFGVKDNVLQKANEKKLPTTLTRSGNTISGTATAKQDDEYLFLPMTYDTGYTATVNGKEAEIYPVLDAFFALKLQKGENTIALRYVPRGFQTGLFLSALGVVCFIFALWALRKNWVRKLRCLYRPIYGIFAVLVGLVFLAIYILPMVIWFLGKFGGSL
ncbi:MAG: YfhO family protein [Oscillospiraceae bacterium]|nr:YfhO family protein [Oscillospiraceae bacterium]